MKVITIANQKGGCGKSTTAAALAALLAQDGYRVLCIDMNEQSDLSETLGAAAGGTGSIGLFTGAEPLKLVQDSRLAGVWIIPAGEDIGLLDMQLQTTGRDRALLLEKALHPLRRPYRYCIIDAPGSFNTAMLNALAVSDMVIIPAQADAYSLKGVRRIIGNIRHVQATVNPALQIGGILLTRYQGRRNLSKDAIAALQEAEKAMGVKLFAAKIRENSKIAEAPGMKKTIIEYAPGSIGAIDYKAFYQELKDILQEGR